MGAIKPEALLKKTTALADSIKEAKQLVLKVGLPVEKVSSKAYKNGMTVLRIAAIHEYGLANSPKRSFLNVPFQVKRKDLTHYIANQFQKVKEGSDAKKMLSLVGVQATNISKEAFRNDGYGTWPPLEQSTIDRKGSSKPLIDTGLLRKSITWVVTKK